MMKMVFYKEQSTLVGMDVLKREGSSRKLLQRMLVLVDLACFENREEESAILRD